MASDRLALRQRAVGALKIDPSDPRARFISTQDMYSKVRAVCDLTPLAAQPFNTTLNTSANADLHAFDYAIGDQAAIAGFGTKTNATQRHTNLRQKRRLNDGASGLVQAFHIVAEPLKKPVATTDANTAADDSDAQQQIAPDPDSFGRDYVAKLFAADYSAYVQKQGGQKEYLGPIEWQATESGVLFAEFAHPEGWAWPQTGQGSELIFGFERTHNSVMKVWAADTDRPWEDVYTALGISPTGSGPSAGTALVCFDLTVIAIGAFGGTITA